MDVPFKRAIILRVILNSLSPPLLGIKLDLPQGEMFPYELLSNLPCKGQFDHDST